jgi:hypothetical protein
MPRCPKCGTDNKATARFCRSCGSAMPDLTASSEDDDSTVIIAPQHHAAAEPAETGERTVLSPAPQAAPTPVSAAATRDQPAKGPVAASPHGRRLGLGLVVGVTAVIAVVVYLVWSATTGIGLFSSEPAPTIAKPASQVPPAPAREAQRPAPAATPEIAPPAPKPEPAPEPARATASSVPPPLVQPPPLPEPTPEPAAAARPSEPPAPAAATPERRSADEDRAAASARERKAEEARAKKEARAEKKKREAAERARRAAEQPAPAVTAPPPPPPPDPEVSRWSSMKQELEGCGGINIICRERVRWKYCSGHWGKVAACPSKSD